jgi:hypothetical protein
MDVWKQRETLRFLFALVRHARALGRDGSPSRPLEFMSDCVPESEQAADPSITGWAFKKLQDAHVIEPCYVTQNGVRVIVDGKPVIKRRASNRPGRNDAWSNLWQFTSPAAADEFLRRNEPLVAALVPSAEPAVPEPAAVQEEMFSQPVESPP